MHPHYPVSRAETLAQRLDASRFRVEKYGRSLHGRPLLAIHAGLATGRPLVLQVRVHPYESIGSFMMEGMLQWLAGGNDEAARLLARHRFVFVPMPNPDGVAEGLCKRTAGGLDLNCAVESREPEGVALTALYRDLRPLSTFDIHGFMHQNDGFGASDGVRGFAVRDRLMALPEWQGRKLTCHEAAASEAGLANPGDMAQHEFGSVRFGGSWTWYGRDAGTLKRMGVALLNAYAAQF
jgi:hypothetical protein